MPSSTSFHESFSGGGRLLALWLGIAAGPFAWAALLEVNYALSYVACEQRQTWMLHLATVAALALVAAGAWGSWVASPPLSGDTSATGESRARFMAVAGLVLCGGFALVIAATEIPALMLHPCTP